MLEKLTSLCVRYIQKFMPEPFLFAIILTLIVVILDFVFVPKVTLPDIIDSWYQGVWGKSNIFTFALQMILVLVCGTTLAQSPTIKTALK